jgi:hypothetical protein
MPSVTSVIATFPGEHPTWPADSSAREEHPVANTRIEAAAATRGFVRNTTPA